jgi:hypothetical protein
LHPYSGTPDAFGKKAEKISQTGFAQKQKTATFVALIEEKQTDLWCNWQHV